MDRDVAAALKRTSDSSNFCPRQPSLDPQTKLLFSRAAAAVLDLRETARLSTPENFSSPHITLTALVGGKPDSA